jgi:hypothetical protein
LPCPKFAQDEPIVVPSSDREEREFMSLAHAPNGVDVASEKAGRLGNQQHRVVVHADKRARSGAPRHDPKVGSGFKRLECLRSHQAEHRQVVKKRKT